jgi:hypothetical protein
MPTSITGNATLSASNAWAAAVATFGTMKNAVHVVGSQPNNTALGGGLESLGCYYTSSIQTVRTGNVAVPSCDSNGRRIVVGGHGGYASGRRGQRARCNLNDST